MYTKISQCKIDQWTQPGKVSADVYPVAQFVPRSLQVVSSRQFRRDRRVCNRVSLNNSRSIRRRSSVSSMRMEAAPVLWALPAIITTTPSPPVLLSRAFNFLIFSVPRRSFEAIVTVRYDCSISRSADRSLPGGRRLQTIRAYTPGIPGIETEGSGGAQGISSSFWSSFIPAFLLDNEHPGYRKERAAYGCQKLLPVRLTNISRNFATSHYHHWNYRQPTTDDFIPSNRFQRSNWILSDDGKINIFNQSTNSLKLRTFHC